MLRLPFLLLGGVVAGACYAVPTFLGRSAALGLGYGAATCWACFGMTKGDAPQVVKDVATYGGYLVAVVSAAASSLDSRIDSHQGVRLDGHLDKSWE